MNQVNFRDFSQDYIERLKRALDLIPVVPLELLSSTLMLAWSNRRRVFLFGNGGSAGNAIHLANDFLYGVSRQFGHALRVTALTANPSVITCLANDEGYDEIFIRQLAVLAEPGDIVIAFSGSGNSLNVIRALQYCKENQIRSFAVLGYSGGDALRFADHAIHVPVNDMQISEDLQMVVGHLMVQWLYAHRDQITSS